MKQAKCGTVEYPLGQQIADTMAAHGYVWTLNYYMSRGATAWEFNILWLGATGQARDAAPAWLDGADEALEGRQVRCLLLI